MLLRRAENEMGCHIVAGERGEGFFCFSNLANTDPKPLSTRLSVLLPSKLLAKRPPYPVFAVSRHPSFSAWLSKRDAVKYDPNPMFGAAFETSKLSSLTVASIVT